MDAEAAQDEREPVRTAKSCGPGAPTQALKSLVSMSPTTDGGNQAWSPGRARRKPLKPLAQGGPGYPAEPVVLPRAFFLHAGHGYQQIPGLPCALSIVGGTCLPHHSGAMRRENAEQCLALFETLGCLKSRIGTTIPHGDLALCKRQTVWVIRS
jgi:hypothetical protein